MEEVGNDVLQEMAVSLKANLHDYAKTVHSTGYDWRTDCDDLGEDSGDWTLSNSLVYALTISTTIGKGASQMYSNDVSCLYKRCSPIE